MNTCLQLRDSDWVELQRVLHEILPELPSAEVWAFGSRARKDAKPYSDLDIAIVAKKPLSLAEMARITDAFEQSDLSIRVDVLDWAAANPRFQAAIGKDRVLLQGFL